METTLEIDAIVIEEEIYHNETKIKLKQLLDSYRSNKIHTEAIMTLPSLKDAHIYCKYNNLSGQFTGPVLEKYINPLPFSLFL